jgi:hypothetical protein
VTFGGFIMTIGTVLCPGCKVPMLAIGREPIPLSDDLLNVIYRCEECSTETLRAVREDPQCRVKKLDRHDET